jgi:hypothetical protein
MKVNLKEVSNRELIDEMRSRIAELREMESLLSGSTETKTQTKTTSAAGSSIVSAAQALRWSVNKQEPENLVRRKLADVEERMAAYQQKTGRNSAATTVVKNARKYLAKLERKSKKAGN